ncbi:MAG TPA: hypothetical protein VLQ93_17055, partial [Myxococcaceae bacterium]|nr:hypothetical protein [Myxococcaceae bacterium]
HAHTHTRGCGHTSIRHGDHVDYLHEGHLHRHEGAECRECRIEVSAQNPERCTPQLDDASHEASHQHGPQCGHEAVPHGDHTDYLVGGHLHHPHSDHCDDHGALNVVG